MRRLPPLLVLLCGHAHAQLSPPAPTPVLLALRQQAWRVAEALAAAEPDPLAVKLVTFIRLLNPGQASAAELQRFMAANPGWPDQDTLERRYAEALANEPDGRLVASLCERHAPGAAPAQLRCAEAWALAGDAGRAGHLARQAWIGLPGSPSLEDDVLARWGGTLTQADQRERYDRLEPVDPAGAGRQLARLDPPVRMLDSARLAFHRRDPDALATLTAVPPALRADPALLLAEARYLRRSGADSAALALWRTALPEAERATPPDRRPAFWAERDALARDLLDGGDADGAYFLADAHGLPPEQTLDAAFLAGWIALRRLHDPVLAGVHFQALANGAHAAITQARAFYWLARSRTGAEQARFLARASAWPTTYYGQLAARAAGETDEALQARIAALRDPATTQGQADQFARTELARAAAILVSWADPRRAADFLRQQVQPPATDTDRALAAGLARRLNLPDMAVQAARLAGRDGVILAGSGWPAPIQPPDGPVPPALVLGVMRQESSFDATATSAAGARGLMQLMPATAAQTARALHAPSGPLVDPDLNIRLGTAYLGMLLVQFGGQQPCAVAAYNAGTRRVRDWMTAHSDPGTDPEAMIDWIELIPFAETRNYVQRVLENQTIYQARPRGAG